MALNCHCIPMQLGTIHSNSSPLLILRENQYMTIRSRPLIQNLWNSDLMSGGRQKLKQISVQKLCANSNDENPSTVEAGPEGLESSSSKIDKKAQEREAVKKGQTTAIITGAISVILGVGYLLLVQLLDTRGVILVPPPPEAFDP